MPRRARSPVVSPRSDVGDATRCGRRRQGSGEGAAAVRRHGGGKIHRCGRFGSLNDTNRPTWRIMRRADRAGRIELTVRPVRPWMLRYVGRRAGRLTRVARLTACRGGWSALSCVPARIAPVDDAYPSVAADDDRARPRLERPNRCTDLHVTLPFRVHRPRFALPGNRFEGETAHPGRTFPRRGPVQARPVLAGRAAMLAGRVPDIGRLRRHVGRPRRDVGRSPSEVGQRPAVDTLTMTAGRGCGTDGGGL